MPECWVRAKGSNHGAHGVPRGVREFSSVGVLAIDGPDLGGILVEGVEMDHPVEDNGDEFAPGGVAFGLGGDGSFKTKFCVRPPGFAPVAQRGAAEIHVLMPLRDAQRNAPIQIVFGESSRSRIHHADEAIAVAVFLIEQGRGMLGVEPGGCFGSVGVVCK